MWVISSDKFNNMIYNFEKSHYHGKRQEKSQKEKGHRRKKANKKGTRDLQMIGTGEVAELLKLTSGFRVLIFHAHGGQHLLSRETFGPFLGVAVQYGRFSPGGHSRSSTVETAGPRCGTAGGDGPIIPRAFFDDILFDPA